MNSEPSFLVVDCEDRPWEMSPRPRLSDAAPTLRYRTLIPGGDGLPSVHMTEYEPGFEQPRHRHVENEVHSIYHGEVEIAGVLHKAPAVIYVAGGTLYGPLKAGPAGVKFFSFGYSEDMLSTPGTRRPPRGADTCAGR